LIFSIPSKKEENMETTVSTPIKKFIPSTEKIVVAPIMRQRNPLITDPEHEAYFLFGTATNTYCLPLDRQGNLVDPFLSLEEKTWLERELDLDLNHHKRENNYFKLHKVRLGKEKRTLDLSNPKDYLDYIILRANKKTIAPDGASSLKLATYKYALEKESFREETIAKKADVEIECFMALGKIKDDNTKMANLLKVYGKKVSPQSKSSFLISELRKIITEDPKEFLEVVNNQEDYEIKLLIAEGIEAGAIIKKGRKYFLPGGDHLCGEGEVPVLQTVIDYLQSPAQQDLLLGIKARIDKFKK
jgi:hypothetical protein